MVTGKQDFEALIVRYLEGNASPDEAMALEDAKASDPEVQDMYDHYEQLLLGDKVFVKPDTKSAWKTVKAQVEPKGKVISLRMIVGWSAAAAAILIVALLLPGLLSTPSTGGALASIPKGSTEQQNENILFAKNNVSEFRLVDNSLVSLSKGSSLELSSDFATRERRSKLKGSGRFTVVHDEQHPFVIEVEGMEVYDIGTVFDIQTDDDTVKVVVLEGAVELRLNGEVIAMEEGDSAFYVISEKFMEMYGTEEARQDTIFNFEKTKLHEVVEILKKSYKKEIVIMNDEIRDCELTVTFKNKSLAEVLDIIELILDVNTVRKPSKIEIYGEGCQ